MKYLQIIMLLLVSSCTSSLRDDDKLKAAFYDMNMALLEHGLDSNGIAYPSRSIDEKRIRDNIMQENGYKSYRHFNLVFLKKYGADTLFKFVAETIFILVNIESDNRDEVKKRILGINIEMLVRIPIESYIDKLAVCYHSNIDSILQMYNEMKENYENLLKNTSNS